METDATAAEGRMIMVFPFECPVCGHKTNMPQTNADKIRSMTDAELALWICGVYDSEEENGKFINGIIIPGYAPHDIEEWLQQPPKGE